MTREEALRDACQERCGGFGDMACYQIDYGGPAGAVQRAGFTDWCRDCIADVEGPQPEPQDPNAAIKDMFS